MASPFVARFDRAAEQRMLAAYKPKEVDAILAESAKAGAKQGASVLKGAAPVGVSARLSQFYRRMGLGHGTFRRSVRAAAIRGRRAMVSGLQGRTVGYVMGPIGRNAFTRNWIESGTRHAPHANPWVERTASEAFAVAHGASEAVLLRYARDH